MSFFILFIVLSSEMKWAVQGTWPILLSLALKWKMELQLSLESKEDNSFVSLSCIENHSEIEDFSSFDKEPDISWSGIY